jgi:hypothetical protein
MTLVSGIVDVSLLKASDLKFNTPTSLVCASHKVHLKQYF